MKSFAALTLFVAAAIAQSLQINTPSNVVECEPTLITWSGGTPPYFLSILPGDSPNAAALESLGQQTGTSVTWKADIQSGTSIGLTLRDNTGATANSAAFSINSGSDSSCVGKNSASSGGSSTTAAGGGGSSSSSSAASGGSTTSASVSSPVATTPSSSATKPATSTTASSSPSGSTTGTSAPAATTSTGAAKMNAANMGVAAVIGAAAMAILA